MPQIIEKKIGYGGDYDTVPNWINAMAAAYPNFTTSDIICKGLLLDREDYFESMGLAKGIRFVGATTDATRYWWLDVDEKAKGNTIPGLGARMVATGADARVITAEGAIRISNLEIDGQFDTSFAQGIGDDLGTQVWIENCFIHNFKRSGTCYAISLSTQNVYLFNNVICDIHSTSNAAAGIYNVGYGGIQHICGNAIHNINGNHNVSKSYGILYSKIVTAANNIMKNNTVGTIVNSGTAGEACYEEYEGGGSLTASNNASSDDTAPGTNPQKNKAAGTMFEDGDNDNLYLRRNGPTHRNGADLSSMSNYPQTDINGVTRRSGYYDIGPYQYIGKRRRILNAMRTILWNITKENGYNSNLARNSLVFLAPEEGAPTEYPALTYIVGDAAYTPLTTFEYTSGGGQNTADGWNVGVIGYVHESEVDTSKGGNKTELMEDLIEDIIRALQNSYKLGLGFFVHNCYLVAIFPMVDLFTESISAFQVLFQVKYDFDRMIP